ncbi:copper homeostasis CutC domain-containing protein [Vararia minispora EC-137]|uniref:Copper homeostasis CutC domain-containing protein n=1 Tax=Vararia minispora EC-137 TaxID=1314806 RepID=A0ACB8QQ92_9AGAM|nr:copper homeostasis CutC domain-containing protein [Vararia minispora EC-137]
MTITLEICVDSLESATNAVEGGADRLEICANLGIGGGTTPSVGLVNALRGHFPHTPLMAMVRPRVGDFVYTDGEMEAMLDDIRAFKQAGAAGVVFGILDERGCVDVERTKRLVDEALPMQVCFHRAFDMTLDPFEAYDALSRISGITRILTSGHGRIVPDSFPVLRDLFMRSRAPDCPLILPGSGINADTIDAVLSALLPFGLREVHLSGGRWMPGRTAHRIEGMGMGAGDGHDWDVWRTTAGTVRAIRRALDETAQDVPVNRSST